MATKLTGTPPDVGLYLDLYAAATSQKERAEIEVAIVEEYVRAGAPCGPKYMNIAVILGIPRNELAYRLALARSPIPPPWDLVERCGSMQVAFEVFQHRGRDGLELYLNGGREAGQLRNRNLHKDKRKAAAVAVAAAIPWTDIRTSVLGALNGSVSDRLRARFESDLKALFKTWRDEISNDKARSDRVVADQPDLSGFTANRRQLVAACRLLSIDPPKPGRAADLTGARRAQRRLSRVYHPDANAGSPHLIEKFHEVNAAFRLIETYNESIIVQSVKPEGE